MRLARCSGIILSLIGLLLLVGCGSELCTVSGEIKLDGKPLPNGYIEFHPLERQATVSGAQIRNGYFALPPDKGLEPGKYRVRITSPVGDSKVKDPVPGEPGPEIQDRIPREYNDENSTLTFEVKAGKSNVFNYNVPTRPPE